MRSRKQSTAADAIEGKERILAAHAYFEALPEPLRKEREAESKFENCEDFIEELTEKHPHQSERERIGEDAARLVCCMDASADSIAAIAAHLTDTPKRRAYLESLDFYLRRHIARRLRGWELKHADADAPPPFNYRNFDLDAAARLWTLIGKAELGRFIEKCVNRLNRDKFVRFALLRLFEKFCDPPDRTVARTLEFMVQSDEPKLRNYPAEKVSSLWSEFQRKAERKKERDLKRGLKSGNATEKF